MNKCKIFTEKIEIKQNFTTFLNFFNFFWNFKGGRENWSQHLGIRTGHFAEHDWSKIAAKVSSKLSKNEIISLHFSRFEMKKNRNIIIFWFLQKFKISYFLILQFFQIHEIKKCEN